MQKAISGIIIVAAIGGFVYYKKQAAVAPAPYATPTTSAGSESINPAASSTGTVSPVPPSGITMAQVRTHNSRTSCWAVISGSVYDLTSWIPNHPGGEQNILQLCGTDGTAKFNGQHGGDSRAKSVLSGFKIGALAQ